MKEIFKSFFGKILNLVCRIYLTNNIKDFSSGIFNEKTNNKRGFTSRLWSCEFFIEFIYKLYSANYKIKIPYTQKLDEIVSNSKTSPNIGLF